MNQKTLLVVLMVSAILGTGYFLSSTGLIGISYAQVLRDNLGALDTVSVETYPEIGIEIKNGTAGGTFVVPPSNAYTEITEWSSINDNKDLYKFTANNDTIIVSKGSVADLTNAQGKLNGSQDSYEKLGGAVFKTSNLSHKYTGIAPIFDSANQNTLEEVYLSLFSLRGTILENFITDGQTTIPTSSGDITLDSSLTLEVLTKAIFGTSNEKKQLSNGENWGIMRLSSTSPDVMDKTVDAKISTSLEKYKIYSVTMSNQPTIKNVLSGTLFGNNTKYQDLDEGQQEIVDVLLDGIANYATGDIIAIPVRDANLQKTKGVAVMSSKNPVSRSN